MSFTDSHIHLHFPDFSGDFDEVLKRARMTLFSNGKLATSDNCFALGFGFELLVL